MYDGAMAKNLSGEDWWIRKIGHAFDSCIDREAAVKGGEKERKDAWN